MRNPIQIATKAKGGLGFLKRTWAIGRRYGLTPTKMDRALAQFSQVLGQFDCNATFPITGLALRHKAQVISKYQDQGIEFAVHGYAHVDYSQLSLAEQSAHLSQADRLFRAAGIQVSGFRCPYLRWNPQTLQALTQFGFDYDSSQALFWDVVDGRATPTYRRVLGFYGAQPAADYPSLPRLEGELVRIPYSVPDDEALVERLALASLADGSRLWLAILEQTHQLGELFSLGLHPERIALCRQPLSDTLAAARQLSPAVWIARLDQIATWWRARAQARVDVQARGEREFQVTVDGPPGTSVLTRNVGRVDAPARPWADGYHLVEASTFGLQASQRPLLGVAPGSSDRLLSFLRQQGYVVEIAPNPTDYATYLDRSDLAPKDERALLTQLEKESGPLLKLGRWPHGARSALSVSGDIDALTLGDYVRRFLGR